MATVKRNSTGMLRSFGAEIFATDFGSSFKNIVRNGQGGERTPGADLARFQGQQVEAASIHIAEYQLAKAYLDRRGAEPLASKTMALILLDVAKVQGISVVELLDRTSTEALALLEAEAYRYVNLLRENTSQLTGTNSVNNAQSYRARYLLP
jgi:hypothetical protein